QGVWPAIFSPHWERIEHDCRKRAGHFRLKEHVARGDGKRAVAMAGGARWCKSESVEMTAMIRGEHKWAVRRQLLPADDGEAMCDREITSDQRKTSVMREAFKKSAFASHAAKPFAWSQARVVGRLEIPRFHQISYPPKLQCR